VRAKTLIARIRGRDVTGRDEIDDKEACWGRRQVIGAGVALAPVALAPLGLAPWLARPARADDPSELHPQPGDHLVFLTGAKKDKIIRPEDLPLGGPQFEAYPQSPDGILRDGSRLNLLIVIRLDPASLSPATAANAAGGVVAYSGVCTHQGCPVNAWSDEQKMMVCSCHGSTYDPRDGAKLLFGPAPRPLPALPLKLVEGNLAVAAGFSARLGGETA
jgi:nitrite reductase/ring-hydroxylating ferredoxin subunit